jgi:flavodoxin short chain
VYESTTGNTERMARAIESGAKSVEGVVTVLKRIDEIKPDEIAGADAIILGCPTRHHDLPSTVKNFIDALAKFDLKGKQGSAFGSYGWSGEAVNLILANMKSKGMSVKEPGIRAAGAPDDQCIEECKNLGKIIAESIKQK